MKYNECELYDRECISCGECEICDLNEDKRCDNCGKCLDEEKEYRILELGKFVISGEENNEDFEDEEDD